LVAVQDNINRRLIFNRKVDNRDSYAAGIRGKRLASELGDLRVARRAVQPRARAMLGGNSSRVERRLVPDDADPTPGHRQSVCSQKLTTTNEEAPRTSGDRLPEIVVVTATRITQLVACVP
jgi:hypothetical protein